MEEKKETKISLGTAICIFSVVLIVVLGIIYYFAVIKGATEKNKTQSDIANIQTYNHNEENIVKESHTANNIENLKANTNQKNIEGTYSITGELEGIAYTFKNGEVTLETNATEIGTYEIVGNTVKIKFTKIIEPADDKTKNISREEELTIQDENTLIDKEYNTKYIKGANTNISTNTSTSTSKSIKYKFESADNLAASGNPGILNIYELTDNKMEFDYNHGWNFSQSTIDSYVSGIANKNSEGLYEYNEDTAGYKYKITIKYTSEKITLCEYKDGSLISKINLWS